MLRRFARLAIALPACVAGRSASGQVLANAHVRAEFDARGLHAITERTDNRRYAFESDGFSVTIGEETYSSSTAATATRLTGPGRITYRYVTGRVTVSVRYELRPDWHFVSKQIEV